MARKPLQRRRSPKTGASTRSADRLARKALVDPVYQRANEIYTALCPLGALARMGKTDASIGRMQREHEFAALIADAYRVAEEYRAELGCGSEAVIAYAASHLRCGPEAVTAYTASNCGTVFSGIVPDPPEPPESSSKKKAWLAKRSAWRASEGVKQLHALVRYSLTPEVQEDADCKALVAYAVRHNIEFLQQWRERQKRSQKGGRGKKGALGPHIQLIDRILHLDLNGAGDQRPTGKMKRPHSHGSHAAAARFVISVLRKHEKWRLYADHQPDSDLPELPITEITVRPPEEELDNWRVFFDLSDGHEPTSLTFRSIEEEVRRLAKPPAR
ncbi:MAG: hypothetical protein ACHQ4J_05035 [Candidatus Binatia bacterium]